MTEHTEHTEPAITDEERRRAWQMQDRIVTGDLTKEERGRLYSLVADIGAWRRHYGPDADAMAPTLWRNVTELYDALLSTTPTT